jgi:di/tricarboxylate transporter
MTKKFYKKIFDIKLKLSQKLFAIMLSIPILLVASLLYYSILQLAEIKNKPKEQLAKSTSASVMDKIDRSFSERFMT